MAFSEAYRRQVDLLLRVIPFITKETCFALKGGTAINLFVRDLPRLSVDIDLTYIPVFPRPKSLGAIDKAMKRIAARIAKGNKATRTSSSIHEGAVTKLVVREHDVQIIIEVTPVLRGCAYEPEMRSVTASVEEQFGFAEMRVLAFADLYAGKIVAALDRQHPRDLFDVRVLLSAEGITDEIRSAFIVYLLSHTRPMWEVLTAPPIGPHHRPLVQGIQMATVRGVANPEADPCHRPPHRAAPYLRSGSRIVTPITSQRLWASMLAPGTVLAWNALKLGDAVRAI